MTTQAVTQFLLLQAVHCILILGHFSLGILILGQITMHSRDTGKEEGVCGGGGSTRGPDSFVTAVPFFKLPLSWLSEERRRREFLLATLRLPTPLTAAPG